MSAEAARSETVLQTAPAAGATENVDRIREILFGSQMREYGTRFAQLEERLLRETAEIKAELRRRLDSLEASTRQEMGALADRLNSERNERTESSERILRELADGMKCIEKRLIQSDEQAAKDLRELRQLTLDRHKSLADELTQALANAEMLQARRLEDLRASAVDRTDLSSLLSEIAMRVRGEFNVLGAEIVSHAGAGQ